MQTTRDYKKRRSIYHEKSLHSHHKVVETLYFMLMYFPIHYRTCFLCCNPFFVCYIFPTLPKRGTRGYRWPDLSSSCKNFGNGGCPFDCVDCTCSQSRPVRIMTVKPMPRVKWMSRSTFAKNYFANFLRGNALQSNISVGE